MLNLLFISDSPKAEYIKGVLQPVLKVIIDVVTDFDHGLKDVFEKRPATICIQDQIGGVTGESVARHIQMLLGKSAPTFILLYAGNDKPKTIKGLYEHFIDLSQPDNVLAEDVINTLKSLLGDQWEKIYIQPKLSPAAVRSSVAVPEASREVADKLVDDFLSDLEASGSSFVDEPPLVTPPDYVPKVSLNVVPSETTSEPDVVPGTVESDRVRAISNDLAEILLAETEKSDWSDSSTAESPAIDADLSVSPVLSGTSPAGTLVAKSSVSAPGITVAKAPSAPLVSPVAAFRISQKPLQTEDDIPEDLLLAIEKNYRSESNLLRRSVVMVLVCVVCAAGAWYFVKQNPLMVSLLKKRFISSSVANQPTVTLPVVVPVQKPVNPAPLPVVTPVLPAFIPKEGHDSSYAVKNPGWERYVGKFNEFRVFSSLNSIKALQVLAVEDVPVSESLIKSILQYLVGSPEYQITSRNKKSGVSVENGRMKNKGEIVIYRKNGVVKAFVVSVN